MPSLVETQARQLWRSAGARLAAPRLQVLAAMLESGYEWLVEQGLPHE
jgi:hypothetical protein